MKKITQDMPTDSFEVLHDPPTGGKVEVLQDYLETFSGHFHPTLTAEKDLPSYAAKLQCKSHCITLHKVAVVVGFAALYANEKTTKRAFLPLFAVLPTWQGTEAARTLMEIVKQIAQDSGMRSIGLEVSQDNPRAIRFYERSGFRIASPPELLSPRGGSVEMVHFLAEK